MTFVYFAVRNPAKMRKPQQPFMLQLWMINMEEVQSKCVWCRIRSPITSFLSLKGRWWCILEAELVALRIGWMWTATMWMELDYFTSEELMLSTVVLYKWRS